MSLKYVAILVLGLNQIRRTCIDAAPLQSVWRQPSFREQLLHEYLRNSIIVQSLLGNLQLATDKSQRSRSGYPVLVLYKDGNGDIQTLPSFISRGEINGSEMNAGDNTLNTSGVKVNTGVVKVVTNVDTLNTTAKASVLNQIIKANQKGQSSNNNSSKNSDTIDLKNKNNGSSSRFNLFLFGQTASPDIVMTTTTPIFGNDITGLNHLLIDKTLMKRKTNKNQNNIQTENNLSDLNRLLNDDLLLQRRLDTIQNNVEKELIMDQLRDWYYAD